MMKNTIKRELHLGIKDVKLFRSPFSTFLIQQRSGSFQLTVEQNEWTVLTNFDFSFGKDEMN